MRISLFIIVACLLPAAPTFARNAGDEDRRESLYDLPPAVAIQSRQYEMKHSVLGTVGYIPTDSFNRGFTFTGAYRYGLTNYLSWEVLSFTHVFNRETQVKKDLFNLGVQVENVGLGGVLDYPRQIYMTGIHYSPMYSKSLFFNSKLVYSETSLFFGIGSLNFNQVGFKPMIAPGASARFYLSPDWAVSLYFRNYYYQDDNVGINGILDFGIGFEYRIGGSIQGLDDE